MAGKQDAKEAVLKYLTLQNRPYSANDVTQNMHKEFGKTAIQKALDELAASGQIKEKVYGKQKVYAPLQQSSNQGDMNDVLQQLDAEINNVQRELATAEQHLKAFESELKSLRNQTTTEEATKYAEELQAEITGIREKLDGWKENIVKVDQVVKARMTKENDKLSTEYRKRKRICMDMAGAILENYPKSKKAFFEEVGIETDDDVSR